MLRQERYAGVMQRSFYVGERYHGAGCEGCLHQRRAPSGNPEDGMRRRFPRSGPSILKANMQAAPAGSSGGGHFFAYQFSARLRGKIAQLRILAASLHSRQGTERSPRVSRRIGSLQGIELGLGRLGTLPAQGDAQRFAPLGTGGQQAVFQAERFEYHVLLVGLLQQVAVIGEGSVAIVGQPALPQGNHLLQVLVSRGIPAEGIVLLQVIYPTGRSPRRRPGAAGKYSAGRCALDAWRCGKAGTSCPPAHPQDQTRTAQGRRR